MSPTEANHAIDHEKDAQTVLECIEAGKPIPPDVVQRVRERADKAREQILATHGLQDTSAEIFREIRGELPNP